MYYTKRSCHGGGAYTPGHPVTALYAAVAAARCPRSAVLPGRQGAAGRRRGSGAHGRNLHKAAQYTKQRRRGHFSEGRGGRGCKPAPQPPTRRAWPSSASARQKTGRAGAPAPRRTPAAALTKPNASKRLLLQLRRGRPPAAPTPAPCNTPHPSTQGCATAHYAGSTWNPADTTAPRNIRTPKIRSSRISWPGCACRGACRAGPGGAAGCGPPAGRAALQWSR